MPSAWRGQVTLERSQLLLINKFDSSVITELFIHTKVIIFVSRVLLYQFYLLQVLNVQLQKHGDDNN